MSNSWFCCFAVGDISLGCWTDAQQAKHGSKAASGNLADAADQSFGKGTRPLSDKAQQAAAAGSSDMDLTNYFATLRNEVLPFKDLIASTPVSLPYCWCAVPSIDTPRHNPLHVHAYSLSLKRLCLLVK